MRYIYKHSYEPYKTILNHFNNRSTNASAESFNAKIKAFRLQFRGVRNVHHQRHVIKDKKEVPTVCPRVHIAISNFRKVLVGIHHGVKSACLRNYLNEFCYKFNRRYLQNNLLDNLIVNSVKFL